MPAKGVNAITTQQDPATEVLVVGGGIIGLAVAWRARRSGHAVALVERGELASGASRVAAGMLAPVAEAEYGGEGRELLALGLASRERWPDFAHALAAASGLDPGLRRGGTLMVARDRDAAEGLERELAFRERLGFAVRRLRPSEARALEPALAPSVRLALELPDDLSVDPRRVTAALGVAAARAGVAVHERRAVARLLVQSGRVTGVELAGGERLRAERVVVAAGAWSGTIAGLPAGAGVPVRPVKGQILRLRDPAGPGLLGHVVRFQGGYLVPRGDGRYVLGATMEERGFDTAVTAGAVTALLRDAAELVPGISELELGELSAGLRPGTPDNLPAIGPGALPGLVWATGHHRNGILLAPLTAELVTATLAGAAPDPLAASCDPGRFAPRSPRVREAPSPPPAEPLVSAVTGAAR
jgi:glycine oxidase